MAMNFSDYNHDQNWKQATTPTTATPAAIPPPPKSMVSRPLEKPRADGHQDAPPEEPEEARGQWSKGIEFFLSLVGYAIGIGNIWRFPYICIKNGGGAFLIPFFLFLFICGMPLFLLELILGQFSSLSPITLWNICPLFRGIGLGMVIVSAIVCVYFNVIMAWSIYYFCMSFWPQLPWATCDNAWNTPMCMDSYSSAHGRPDLNASSPSESSFNKSAAMINAIVNATYSPTEEFWRNYILGQTDSPDDAGSMNWPLLGCLLLAWVSVFFCMFKGVQTSGKVVYVTAVAPYIFLVILIIRGVTLPGAVDGLIFFLKPDFSKLLNYQVWIDACLQIFFSLGPAWGGLITMASFNKFSYNCYRDAFFISILDSGTCFLGGLVIFSVLGNMAYNTGGKVEDFNRAGPGLAFVVYPAALNHLPFPQVWALLFFGMLLTLGIDTQFGMFETVVSGFLDQFKALRKRKTLVIALLALLEFLLGIPFVTGAGYYYFQVIDHYAAALSVTMMALLECLVVGYIYGVDRLSSDMEMMFRRSASKVWKVLWRYVSPVLLAVIVVSGLSQLSEPSYSVIIEQRPDDVITGGNLTMGPAYPVYVQQNFLYPRWLIAIGWLCALSSLVVIPLLAVIDVARAKGSFEERIRKLCRPTSLWVPSPPELRADYLAKYYYPSTAAAATMELRSRPGAADGERLITAAKRPAAVVGITPPPYQEDGDNKNLSQRIVHHDNNNQPSASIATNNDNNNETVSNNNKPTSTFYV